MGPQRPFEGSNGAGTAMGWVLWGGVGWHGHGMGSSPPKKPLPPLGSLFFLLVPGGQCQRRSGQGKAKRALG